MAKDRHDLRITPKGDLALTPEGDLMVATGRLYREQQVRMRMLAAPGEWRSDPNFGADLDAFRGQPNTREVAERMVSRIATALVHDGLFDPWEIEVEAYPTSHEAMTVEVRAYDGSLPPQQFVVGWDRMGTLKVTPA